MHMYVQGCHILRFLKKNMPSHVGDQYVARMQKGIKIGPVVLHIFLGIPGDPQKGTPLGMAITSHIIEQAAPNFNTNKFNLSEKEMCKQNNVLSF